MNLMFRYEIEIWNKQHWYFVIFGQTYTWESKKVSFIFCLRLQYTLFQNGRHLDILLFLFKLDLDASIMAKYSFEFSAQEQGIKG